MSPSLTVDEAARIAGELAQGGDWATAVEVCGKVLAAAPEHAQALHILALAAVQGGRPGEARDLLGRAIKADPGFAVAASDLGNLLAMAGELAEAAESYRRAIAAAPDFAEAHNNLGNVLQMAGALEDAVASYRMALGLRPDYAEAQRNLGSALGRLGRLEEAAAAMRATLALVPDYAPALHKLLYFSRHLCDWSDLDALGAKLVARVEAGRAAINPFLFLCLDTTPAQQLRCARQWSASQRKPEGELPAQNQGAGRSARITLGYLSTDFNDHPMVQVIAELLELHDRSRFRVNGYSIGRDDGSRARQRVRSAVDELVDLFDCSHAEAAARIRGDGVDILIDLNGYTADARPEILLLRPAPIQVSYLGYPGTLGDAKADFILVDPWVVPMDEQPYFSEHLVHLPDCYFVSDSRRPIAPRVPSRKECGLPEDGFVFCSFVSAFKITPALFDVWMRLLGAVPGSVLWLLAPNPTATANLRREADARLAGGSARLIFAPMLPNPEHVARFALADLFLDTLPYNAHTLTTDALWGGCPVITCVGRAFPGRVAASMLRAMHLPELVTDSLADYEALATQLARDPCRLRAIRQKVQDNRRTTPLFDTPRFTRHMEAAFATMWRMQQAGEPFRGFAVAPAAEPPEVSAGEPPC